MTKTDSETVTPQGDGSLAGAVYGLYNNGTLVDTYTTDANGSFTTAYYICGDNWTIREITPSEGYVLDTTIHHVGAEAKNYTVEYNHTANDVTEVIKKGKIAIIKHSDDGSTQIETPEVGAEFEVYLKSAGSYANAKATERDILTCDENGYAVSKDLPYGVYTVHQTKGWDGRELIADFDVYVSSDGEVYRFLINNSNFASYLKIVKTDAETGKTIPYAGAGFQLYDPNGQLVTMTYTYPTVTTIDTFYTNSEGYLITPQTLEYGKGYSLVEVQAPYGYILDMEPIYFDVAQENSEEESGITLIEVVKTNMPQKGVINITKTGEVFSTVTESGGVYQPVYSVTGLSGAVYDIIAAEDIVTPDGTIRAIKGEVVDTVTTDGTGTATSRELYLGRYTVVERTAPYGMVLNEEVHEVELTYAGQEISVTETATSFYNERQRVEISLEKVMEQDEQYGIGDNGEILDVTFGLYAAGDIAAADGSVIPADGLIEITSLDESGHGVCQTDLPFGGYYVKEIATNAAYILGDTEYPVVFEYAGQDTALVKLAANDDENILNEIIRGRIEGIKVDEDGEGLAGATIGLFAPNTTTFTEENALMTAESDEDGAFSFEDVPYGDWIIREIAAPESFVLSELSYPVTISEQGEIIEITIENSLIRGGMKLVKTDTEGNQLDGAVFGLYTDGGELIEEFAVTENGQYVMDDLLYGSYYLLEHEAPEGYRLSETQYPFSISTHGEMIEITMENERIPEEPSTPADNPKTGDSGRTALWLALVGASLAGLIGLGIAGKRRKARGAR